ncbi:MAG: uroporphyrinogen-III C-methyltransferase [Bacteroidota bacterium]
MNYSKVTPKVSLIGAGPGDQELLTLKAVKALQSAKVVLYDALVDQPILDLIPATAEKIYVGKRANKHRFSQEDINMLMVTYALNYGHVVRLKGGDPFIFGRGHEELEFADLFDIPVEYIPGISSSVGLAGLQRVPLTRRHFAQSFWVLTGTTTAGKLSEDIKLAAQSSATLVILMAMRKIKEIADLFNEIGKGDTPVMIIQNGSRPNERVVLGQMHNIFERASVGGIGRPGIIVVGEVVQFHPEFAYEQALQHFQNQSV